MKLASILSIFLSVISVCKAQCGSPVNQNVTMFNDVRDAFDLISNCAFPSEIFNASCVSASCSQLTTLGLCPYTSTRSLNLTSLNTIITILNSCFRQQPTICSAPLTTIAMAPVGIGLSQLFGPLPFGGQCSKTPNSGFFSHVQNVSFSVSPDQTSSPGPLNVVIDAPAITVQYSAQCSISVGSSADPLLTFHLPNIDLTTAIGLTPSASIDFSDDQPVVRVQSDNFSLDQQVQNFVPIGAAIPLPGNLQGLFTNGSIALWKSSGLPTAMATFYATFIAFGIEATKGNCGPTP